MGFPADSVQHPVVVTRMFRYRGRLTTAHTAFFLLLSSMTVRAAEASSAPGFDWVAFLGPFHVVVLHYPIGFLTLVGLLELWSLWSTRGGLSRAIGFGLALSSGAAWVATTLGLLRAARGEFDPDTLTFHRVFGIAVAVLVTAALGAWWRAVRAPGRFWLRGYRGLLAVSLVCLVAAGHQGGSLTHGSTFLTQNAPSFLGGGRKLSPLKTSDSAAVETNLYLSVVKPALERKCYSCHGPEKQKGKFRLDSAPAMFIGGKSGEPSIVPGDPFKSRLVKVLLLPHSDDDAMPPEGKPPLTDGEILAVIQWIQSGASPPLPPTK